MSRTKNREQAFALLFEQLFNDRPVQELAEGAVDARNEEVEAFALALAQGTESHTQEIDACIAAHLHNWSMNRISRVALAVLRLAIYEMQHREDIPVSVSINEAVELAKKYGGEEDASFINGVLGSIARESA